jgi:tetratricopeptide (TPR) repeat protein
MPGYEGRRKTGTVGMFSPVLQELPMRKSEKPYHDSKSAAAPSISSTAAVLILIAGTAAAYWHLPGNGFTNYDDGAYITANRHVMGGLSWDGLRWSLTAFHSANWHPLTWISHMLDVSVFGTWAGGHHLVNLAFHLAGTLLLLCFLHYATKEFWPSILVAAFFALHPLHVESVAWAAERKDVLSAFFLFAVLLAYASYARTPGRYRYLCVIVLYALGLMSKPMLVTVPVVLLVLDYWPLKRCLPVKRLLLEKVPLAAMAAVSALVTLKAQSEAVADLETLGLAERLMNAVASYGTYILQMFWPAGLSVFYPFQREGLALRAMVGAALVAACTAAAVVSARRHRHIIAGWLWYLITLLPVIGIIQVGSQAHADRYTYVPLTGLFIAVVWTIAEAVREKPQAQRYAAAAGIAAAAVLGIMTYRQSGYWKDDLTLFGRAKAVTKDNAVALSNYGVALGTRGRVEEGLAELEKALKLATYDYLNLTAMGDLLLQVNRPEEALRCYNSATAIRPATKEAWLGAARALYFLGRLEEAEDFCRRAISIDGGWSNSWHALGMILAEKNRTDEATAAFQRAAETWPPLAAARLNLGKLYAQKGDITRAIEECRVGIQIEPHYADYDYLGQLLASAGRPAEAEEAFAQAIRLNPAAAEVHYHLAMLLEETGRREAAAEAARKATELAPDNLEIAAYLKQLAGSR